MTHPAASKRLAVAAIVLLLAMLWFRAGVVWMAPPAVFVSLTPDDAYYYLQIARNIALGNGSTFDGVTPTNGYHPLWMMLCTAFFLLRAPAEGLPELLAAARGVALMQLALGAGGLLLLLGCLWSAVRDARTVALAAVGACFPWVIYACTDGLESGLSLLTTAGLLWAFLRVRPTELPPGVPDVALGAAFALCFLARLDAALLCVGFAAVVGALWATGHLVGEDGRPYPLRWFLTKGFLWALPAVVTLGATLALNRAHFDSLSPISGMLKTTFPAPSLVGVRWLLRQPVPFLAGFLTIAAAVALARDAALPAAFRLWLGAGAAFIALHALHTVFFMDWAVHTWHFTAYWPFALAALGCVLGRRLAPGVLALGVMVLGLLAAAAQYRFLHGRTDHAFQPRSLAAAAWARTQEPLAGRLVGMSDCGIFGYFRGGRVVNLDGVVNNRGYQEALRTAGFAAYAQERGLDFIAHHAVDASRVRPGYGSYDYGTRSQLHNQPGGRVELLEKDELYRSPPFNDGTGEKVFLVWRLRPGRTR